MDAPGLPRVSDYDDAPLDMQTKLASMVGYRRKQIQQATVKRLNDLTPENNGRVHAEAVDADATETCENDWGHGAGTVVFSLGDTQFVACAECGIRVIGMMAQDAVNGDVIDVEVYR